MELYLHIGYHKTGSSFLQSLFATNRDWFESQGIYYPKGYRDKEAQSGLISPGNGIEFLTAMNNGDFEKAKLMVGQWKREADNRGCNRILISSEGLFHSFANIGFEKIEHVLNSIGFNKIFGLLYVRDPLDHAISLFKHRSKSGSILDFKQWVERKYETIMLSKVFFQSLHLSKIKWTIRRYNKDKEFMIYSCFIEWLKISKPKDFQFEIVNPSLGLNQIELLANLKPILDSDKIAILQKKFYELGVNQEIEINKLEIYKRQISSWMNNSAGVFELINSKLRPDEKLGEFYFYNVKELSNNTYYYLNLTPEEMDAISQTCVASKFNWKLRLIPWKS